MWKLLLIAALAATQVAAQPLPSRRQSSHSRRSNSDERIRKPASPAILPTQSPEPLPVGSVNIQKPLMQCPRHFSLVGNQCVREDDRLTRGRCPPRSRLENGFCVVETVVDPRLMCPGGSELSGAKCAISETIDPRKECHRDFTLQGDQCVRSREARATIICPPGYRNNVEMAACAREVRGPADFSCPDGSAPGRDSHCYVENIMDPILRCDRGFVLSNGRCMRQSSSEMVCPPGFRRDGSGCMRFYRVEPKPVCQDSYNFDGRSCASTVTTPVQLRCDRGFELSNDKCVKVIEQAVRVECPAGYRYDVGDQGPLCLSVEKTVADLYCDQGKLTGRRCEVTETAELVPAARCDPDSTDESCFREPRGSCPRGHRRDGEHCISHDEVKAKVTCPAGFVLRGRDCIHLDTVPYVTECRAGGELNQSGACVRVEQSDAQSSCPKSYKLKDSKCVLTREFDPVETCPSGSIQNGRKCVATERLSPKTPCTGAEGDAVDCLTVDIREPKMVCSRDFKLVGDVCVSRRDEPEEPAPIVTPTRI